MTIHENTLTHTHTKHENTSKLKQSNESYLKIYTNTNISIQNIKCESYYDEPRSNKPNRNFDDDHKFTYNLHSNSQLHIQL